MKSSHEVATVVAAFDCRKDIFVAAIEAKEKAPTHGRGLKGRWSGGVSERAGTGPGPPS